MFSTMCNMRKFKPIKPTRSIKSKFTIYHNKKQLYIPRPMLREKKCKFHTIANKHSTHSTHSNVPGYVHTTSYIHTSHVTDMKLESNNVKLELDDMKLESDNVKLKVDYTKLKELVNTNTILINDLNDKLIKYNTHFNEKHESIDDDFMLMYFWTLLILASIISRR